MEDDLISRIEHLEAALAFMDQGIFVYDIDLNIVASNDKAAEMVNVPKEMLEVGKNFRDVIRYLSERGDNGPGAVEDLVENYVAISLSNQSHSFERHRPDGRVIEVRVSPKPDGGGVITYTDITERKRSEEAILESKQGLDLMLENVADGLIAIEEHGIIRVFNATAQQIFGYAKEEVVGKNVSMLMPEPDRGQHDSYLRNYRHTGKAQITGVSREVIGRRKDGSSFPLELGIGEVLVGGRRIYIGTLRDISDKKRMEEQLRHSLKMESLGTLSGGIAHDFNSLLTSIIGFTKLTTKQLEGNDTAQSYLNNVLEASARAADLVAQISAFSRTDKPQRLPLPISNIVANALKLVRRTLPASIVVEEDLETNVGVVLLNETEIHQVVINLAGNAADAMGDEGILSVALRGIEVDAEIAAIVPELQKGSYACLTVRDNGSGMDKTTHQRIFDPFFTTKEVGKGTGLGLSVVHGIVTAHDGTVTVSSEPGKGAIFELLFPCVDNPTMDHAKDQSRVSKHEPAEVKGHSA